MRITLKYIYVKKYEMILRGVSKTSVNNTSVNRDMLKLTLDYDEVLTIMMREQIAIIDENNIMFYMSIRLIDHYRERPGINMMDLYRRLSIWDTFDHLKTINK